MISNFFFYRKGYFTAKNQPVVIIKRYNGVVWCVCVCVCVSVCRVVVWVWRCLCMSWCGTYVCVCVHVVVCVCMYVCVYVCMYVCMWSVLCVSLRQLLIFHASNLWTYFNHFIFYIFVTSYFLLFTFHVLCSIFYF